MQPSNITLCIKRKINEILHPYCHNLCTVSCLYVHFNDFLVSVRDLKVFIVVRLAGLIEHNDPLFFVVNV